MADSDDDEELYAFKYGEDWPEAIGFMGKAMLGGRPTNPALGPKQQLSVIIAAAEYRAATPRRPGKGKPLPASEYEKEQETTQRQTTQKLCRKLILPKTANESPDNFIRRLDAHRNAPEALVAPLTPPEDETLFAKRCIAVKDTTELPNVLILPKGSKELTPEFEERLGVAKKVQCLVFPRGAHETSANFKARLQVAKKSKRAIMPKSEREPDKGFHMRVDMQIGCEHVVHPFDPQREDEKKYYRRLQACKEKSALSFEPGDTMAVAHAIGEEHVHKDIKPKRESHADAPGAADVLAEALADTQAVKEAEAKAQAEADAKAAAEEAAKSAAEDEETKVAARIADMKLQQEKARAEAAELARKASFAMEQVNVKTIGFMPLKRLLMERGVPKEQVSAAANKFALVEVAKKWGEELKIDFVDEDPVAVS